MQDDKQPESGETKFSPLGEYGAIPGAPNGPPVGATGVNCCSAIPGGSGAQNCSSEKSDLASVDSQPLSALASGERQPRASGTNSPAAFHPPPTSFFPIRDLPKIAHEDADWIWDGYLARGAVTLLSSEPKAGKSTLVFGLMQKLLAGEPFLGKATSLCGTGRAPCCGTKEGARVVGEKDSHQPERSNAEAGSSSASCDLGNQQATCDDSTGRNRPARATPCGAIYFSEEPLATLREKAERFELPIHGERIQLVSRRHTPNQKISLETALGDAIEKAAAIDAGLIVIDTLSAWSGLRAEEENSAAACEALMAKFHDAATRSNTALLVIHHTRKDKTSPRGSTALTGSADILLLLERDPFEPRDSKLKTQTSKLSVASRFSNVPDPLQFELTDDGYRVIGPAYDATRRYARVYDLLPKEPPGLTRKELIERGGIGRWQLNTALRDLQAHSHVACNGTGTDGDPVRFHRIST